MQSGCYKLSGETLNKRVPHTPESGAGIIVVLNEGSPFLLDSLQNPGIELERVAGVGGGFL